MVPRLLSRPERSFFLFGPRGTGKSTWLARAVPDALVVDLLEASLFLELSRDPQRLEGLVRGRSSDSWIVVDEVQKIPALLDEVHRLMGIGEWRFALCGSSARKLNRGGANLLAGRALTRRMEGFSAEELGDRFALEAALNWGTLPFVWNEPDAAADILAAYVNTYLKEELQAEGLIRQAPPFVRFLAVAGLCNGQVVNAQNLARDAAVARSTVENYFSILTDTMLGHFLPAWRPGVKVREAAQPKFYWFDPGVARAAAGRLCDPLDRLWRGAALETLIFHELRVYNEISRKQRALFYYRTAAGVEIDFIVETARRSLEAPARAVAIEVKLAEKWDRSWEKPMRSLGATGGVEVERMFGVYGGSRRYEFDGVNVLPVPDFLRALYAGEIL